MLIKGSASRFYRRIREDLPAETGWPCLCATLTQKSPAHGKRPPSGSRPTRFSLLRRPHAFRAQHVVSAVTGYAPPVRPAVLPENSPNIAGQPPNSKTAHHCPRVRHQIDVEPSCSPCRSDSLLLRSAPRPGKQRKPCPVFCIRAYADFAVNGTIEPQNAPRVQHA